MVLAIGTSLSTFPSLGSSTTQANATDSASTLTASAPATNFVGSRIRVDNQLDMAILEFRSQQTGDVIRQYPTEPQIRAIQRAADLEARVETSRPAAQSEAPTESSATSGSAQQQPASGVAAVTGRYVQTAAAAEISSGSLPETPSLGGQSIVV